MMKVLVEYVDGRSHTYEARKKLKSVRVFVDDKIKLTVNQDGEVVANTKPRLKNV